MKLNEASIGDRVIYTPAHGEEEHGVVTSKNHINIFVKYDTSRSNNGIATSPEDLRHE